VFMIVSSAIKPLSCCCERIAISISGKRSRQEDN
jgi:hypothetical protein